MLQRRGGINGDSVTGVIADTRPLCPAPNCSAIVPASDHYPTARHPKVSRRLPTPLSWAYVCKSDLYLNIIDFPPHIRYRELVSHCVRLISMAFLSAEHDKCIWEIKFSGWVRFREFLGASSQPFKDFEEWSLNAFNRRHKTVYKFVVNDFW